MSIYLNSTCTLLQLIAFAAETEGSYVTLHGDQVWSHIHVPSMKNIGKSATNEVDRFYEEVKKLDVKPLFRRIREHDDVQRAMNKLALKLFVGLETWSSRLDELYDAVIGELEAMIRLMGVSAKTKRNDKRLAIEKEEERTEPLEKWM